MQILRTGIPLSLHNTFRTQFIFVLVHRNQILYSVLFRPLTNFTLGTDEKLEP
jgi:hypothetical protein